MQTQLNHEQLILFIQFIHEYETKENYSYKDNPTLLMFKAFTVLQMPFDQFLNTITFLEHVGILAIRRDFDDKKVISVNLNHACIWEQFIKDMQHN